MTNLAVATGRVWRVAGPVVVARGLAGVRLANLVSVGDAGLPGEVIKLSGDEATIQVYEETTGIRAGEPVVDTGVPLQVELGPGLLGQIFDGTQRPLTVLAAEGDDPYGNPLIRRGVEVPALDRERIWAFSPSVAVGDRVLEGATLGTVAESVAIEHRILVPPGLRGTVTRVHRGDATVTEPVVWIDDDPVSMLQRWPVRQARPFARLLPPATPLVTGQRVIDVLFPVALGGAATIPGGFGTGKTVLETSLAKWAHVDVVVYVGCGERGNELTEVLEEFPELVDPRTGASLMSRTILIANTSNMPVAAREASIYTGITLAEYYRDQGYHVALMADSTSRWGEALREVSGRLEEMPAEEGYPAYLSTRLAEFYERAGAVQCLDGEREGSVTVVGAVSPAGGDFSEPITQNSLRLAGTFWALDTSLARRRHFPSINWTRSYTLYDLTGWFVEETAPDWEEHREWALDLLQRESSLLEIVQLLGVDSLAPAQRALLVTGRMLRESFLQQSAFDEIDAYCPLDKQLAMLRVIHRADTAMVAAVERGVAPERLGVLPVLAGVGRMRSWLPDSVDERATDLANRIEKEIEAL